MDPKSFSLSIRSHNIHGYNNSRDFLYHECVANNFSIMAIQEHWLKSAVRKMKGTDQLKVLHPEFDAYAVSAMDIQAESNVIKGRPYVGTGFIFAKELSNVIRARVDLKHPRVSVLELHTNSLPILLINAYMPFYDQSNLPEKLKEYQNTIAHLENIMSGHPGSSYGHEL